MLHEVTKAPKEADFALLEGAKIIERTEGWEERTVAFYLLPPNVTVEELAEGINCDTACEIPGVEVHYV